MPGPSQPAKDSQSPRASATPNNASQNPPPLDVMAAYYPDLVQLFEWCQVCKDEHLDIMEKLLRDHYPGFRDFLNNKVYAKPVEGSTENSLHYRLLTKQRTVLDDLQHLPISHLPPAPQSVLTFSHSDEVLRVSSKQGGMDEIAIDHLKRYPLASMFNVYANHDARLLKGDKNDKEPNNNSNSLPMSPSNGNLTSPTSKSVVSASESKNPDEMEVTGPEQIDEELKPAQDCILGSDLALQQIISHWEHPMSYCLQSVPPTQFTIESITPNGSIESVATNNLSLGQQLFADPSKYTPAFKSLLKSAQLTKEELPKGEDDILNATRGRCYVDVWGEESFYDNFAVGNPFLEKLNPLLSWNDLFHNYSENHDGPYREWLVANLRVLRKKRPHDFGLQTVKQKRMKSHNISVDTILAPPVPVSCQHPASWGVGARQGIQSESNSPTTAPNGKQNGKSSKVSASIPKDTFQFVHPASYSSSSMHYFAANLSAPSTNVISQTQMVKNKAPGMRGKKLQPSNSQSGEVKQNVVVVPPLDVFQLDLDIERMEEISMYLDTLNFVAVSELHNLAALEIGLERHRARKEHLQTSLNSLFFQLDPKRSEHAIYPRVRKHRRNSQHQNKRSTFSSATTTAVVSAAIVPSTIPEGNTSSLRVPSTAATSISTDDPDNLKKSRYHTRCSSGAIKWNGLASDHRPEPSTVYIPNQVGACSGHQIQHATILNRLNTGHLIEVRTATSTTSKWEVAVVISVKKDDNQLVRMVKVKLLPKVKTSSKVPVDSTAVLKRGNNSFARWIAVESGQMAPLGTNINAASYLKVGQEDRISYIRTAEDLHPTTESEVDYWMEGSDEDAMSIVPPVNPSENGLESESNDTGAGSLQTQKNRSRNQSDSITIKVEVQKSTKLSVTTEAMEVNDPIIVVTSDIESTDAVTAEPPATSQLPAITTEKSKKKSSSSKPNHHQLKSPAIAVDASAKSSISAVKMPPSVAKATENKPVTPSYMNYAMPSNASMMQTNNNNMIHSMMRNNSETLHSASSPSLCASNNQLLSKYFPKDGTNMMNYASFPSMQMPSTSASGMQSMQSMYPSSTASNPWLNGASTQTNLPSNNLMNAMMMNSRQTSTTNGISSVTPSSMDYAAMNRMNTNSMSFPGSNTHSMTMGMNAATSAIYNANLSRGVSSSNNLPPYNPSYYQASNGNVLPNMAGYYAYGNPYMTAMYPTSTAYNGTPAMTGYAMPAGSTLPASNIANNSNVASGVDPSRTTFRLGSGGSLKKNTG